MGKVGKRICNTKGYRRHVLEMITEYGVIPYDVFRLQGSPYTIQYQRAARTLIDEGILEEFKDLNNVRCLKLFSGKLPIKTMVALEKICMSISVDDQDIRQRIRYMNIRSGDKDRLRNYRMYQNKIINDISAQCFVRTAGIPTDRNLSYIQDGLRPMYMNSNRLKNKDGYYDTITHARKGNDNLRNSRINGLFASPGGVYAVYCIGSHLIEWKRAGEVRMAAYIQTTLSRGVKGYHINSFDNEAVILAKQDKLFADIVRLDYSRKEGKKRVLLNIDFAYEHMYAIPYSADGIRMLRMMQEAGWKESIKSRFLSELEMQDSELVSVGCDGYDRRTGLHTLVFLVPDLTKLKSFVARAAIEKNWDKYRIICYKHQFDTISGLIGVNAHIYTIGIDDVYNDVMADIA